MRQGAQSLRKGGETTGRPRVCRKARVGERKRFRVVPLTHYGSRYQDIGTFTEEFCEELLSSVYRAICCP